MDVAQLLAQAHLQPSPAAQLRFVEANLPDDADLGDVLWAGLRTGQLSCAELGTWWRMGRSESDFSAADVLALLGAVEGTAAEARLAEFAQNTNLAVALQGLEALLSRVDVAALVVGHAQVRGRAGELLRYMLVYRGLLSADVLAAHNLADMACTVVLCSGDTSRREVVERHLSRGPEIWTAPVWYRTVIDILREHLHRQRYRISSFSGLRDALAVMSDAELLELGLCFCPDSDAALMLEVLCARGERLLPGLLALAEVWLADPRAPQRSGKTVNLLVSALLRIRQEGGGALLLEEKYDPLLQDAMGDSQGPLQDLLHLLPQARLLSLLFPTRYQTRFAYFHACPTEQVRTFLVERVRALDARPSWDETHYIPDSIVKIGAPMVPHLHEALRIGGGLHRQIFLRCLETIGDPSSVPVLIAAFSDTAPRVVDWNSSRGQGTERVCDIPTVAADCLLRLSLRLPASAFLPHLRPALLSGDAAVQVCAVRVLAALAPSPAVAALAAEAREAVPERDPRWTLGHVALHGTVPDALAALQAEARALPEAVTAAAVATIVDWKEPIFVDFWAAHGAHGAAVLVAATDKILTAIVQGSLYSFQVEQWARFVQKFADHPAVLPLVDGVLDRVQASRASEAWEILETLEPLLPGTAARFVARCTEMARPPAWRAVYSIPDVWGLDVEGLLLDGLLDDDKAVRSLAAARLARRAAPDLTRVWPLLQSRDKEIRAEAVALIRHFPVPAAIPHLVAAEKGERTKATRLALQAALAVYSAADLAAAPAPVPPATPKKAARSKKATAPAPAPVVPAVRDAWRDWLAHTSLAEPSLTVWKQLTGHIEQIPPSEAEVRLLEAALVGWPDKLRVAPTGWIAEASAVRSGEPPPHWWLARAVVFSRFGSEGSMTPPRIRWLLTSPHMAHITRISLSHLSLSAQHRAIVEHLVDTVHLTGLRHLSVASCGLSEALMDGLAAATHLRLMSLDLSGSVGSVDRLLAMPHMAGLESIVTSLRGCDALIAGLAGSAALPRLAELVSRDVRVVSAASVAAVAGTARPWRHITLGSTALGLPVARAYAGATTLGGLERLCLSGDLGLEGVFLLLDSERLPKLQDLVLLYCGIGPADVATIRAHFRVATLGRFYCSSHSLSEAIHLEHGTPRT